MEFPRWTSSRRRPMLWLPAPQRQRRIPIGPTIPPWILRHRAMLHYRERGPMSVLFPNDDVARGQLLMGRSAQFCATCAKCQVPMRKKGREFAISWHDGPPFSWFFPDPVIPKCRKLGSIFSRSGFSRTFPPNFCNFTQFLAWISIFRSNVCIQNESNKYLVGGNCLPFLAFSHSYWLSNHHPNWRSHIFAEG